MQSLADIRKEYIQQTLSEKDVKPNPVEQFRLWWSDAVKSEIEEVNAMTLATASRDGLPSARIVLLKGFDDLGFVFFTNYESFKGLQMDENPRACLVFFWKELERQVRISGTVIKVSSAESDAYYSSRPEASRIGAWASPQSRVIASREWLEANEIRYKKRFEGQEVPRPPHWGGYRVKPESVEFWQGRASRLHDRILYSPQERGKWKIERLSP